MSIKNFVNSTTKRTRREELPQGFRLHYDGRSFGLSVFLLVWMSIWTLGCVMLAREVWQKQELTTLLFALPFWAAWVFVAFALVSSLTYREILELTREGCELRTSLLLWRKRRFVPLSEIVKFKLKEDTDSESISRSLQLETTGEPLNAFSESGVAELNLLVFQLNEQLRSWGHAMSSLDLPDDDELDEESDDEASEFDDDEATAASTDATPDQNVLELRPPAEVEISPPSSTFWKRSSDLDAETFWQRGRWDLASLGVLLFVCLFWNGIVGVFVSLMLGIGPLKNDAPPWGMRVFLFFFLIPFELVGALIIFGLVAAMFDPLRYSTWKFYRNQITYRLSYAGIGRTWTYEIKELDRLELRKVLNTPHSQKSLPGKGANSGSATKYALACVNIAGEDVCVIKDLALGEAVWLADAILRERSGWFRRR